MDTKNRFWEDSMKRSKTLVNLLLAIWSVQAAEKIKILTTTTDLAAIASFIGGEYVMVYSLATGNEDPHKIIPKPSYILMAHHADIWIRLGMAMEIGYERSILEGARNPRIAPGGKGYLDASEDVVKLDIPQGRIDRSMGDLHPEGNPHYLLDPLNGRIVAKKIAQHVGLLMPQQESYFKERAQQFIMKLDAEMFGEELTSKVGGARLWTMCLDGSLESYLQNHPDLNLGGWLGRMWKFRGQKIVSYHRNWIYFFNRFGFVGIAEIEPKPGIPPTPAHLKKLLDLIRQEEVKIIMQTPYEPLEAARRIQKQIPVHIIIASPYPIGEEGINSYFDVFENLTKKLESAFKESLGK